MTIPVDVAEGGTTVTIAYAGTLEKLTAYVGGQVSS
jgi:hypothetical protein